MINFRDFQYTESLNDKTKDQCIKRDSERTQKLCNFTDDSLRSFTLSKTFKEKKHPNQKNLRSFKIIQKLQEQNKNQKRKKTYLQEARELPP